MSFLPAVQREIANRSPQDPVRVTLEYMLRHAVGRANAVPLGTIVAALRSLSIRMTKTGFQQTILAESRGADYFIGSGPRGMFLIETMDDAAAMRNFYDRRIAAERQNRKNLRRQAALVGWTL
jgi:hypothetical protein